MPWAPPAAAHRPMPMAPTALGAAITLATVVAAARAALQAAHAASGLAWSAKRPGVARAIRSAEGAIRAAIAMLEAAAAEEGVVTDSGAVEMRRTRRGRGSKRQQQLHTTARSTVQRAITLRKLWVKIHFKALDCCTLHRSDRCYQYYL